MAACRWALAAGALLGLGGVVMGALLDHAAAPYVLQPHAAKTALHYHQLHAVLLAAIGLVLAYVPLEALAARRLVRASMLLLAGTIIFCGSLYGLAFTGMHSLAYGAPVGGMTLMLGWAALAVAPWRNGRFR